MRAIRTAIPAVVLLEPRVFSDDRGFFVEWYNQAVLAEVAGVEDRFVQDNHSGSHQGVLRGLHYQIRQPQGKLVRVIAGEVFDVAVDLRRSSPTFGRWVGATLSATATPMIWVPRGFAHGFLVLSRFAEVIYKVTDFYAPQHERSLAWDDPELGIRWPLSGEPILSPKDRAGALLAEAETFE